MEPSSVQCRITYSFLDTHEGGCWERANMCEKGAQLRMEPPNVNDSSTHVRSSSSNNEQVWLQRHQPTSVADMG